MSIAPPPRHSVKPPTPVPAPRAVREAPRSQPRGAADVERPHAILLYHYFYPDDVVSARLYSDLAEGLVARGWEVTAVPCRHSYRDAGVSRQPSEEWNGVHIRRVWRPAFRQHKGAGRLLNAASMLANWAAASVTLPRRRREVVVVGTDPVLGVLAALPWRAARRNTRVVHWCHDLYPEAPIADGMVRASSPSVRLLRCLLGAAYRRCDVMADLGPCMRARLDDYHSPARRVTLTPWSLVEPPAPVEPDPATRAELFGGAALGLLYSGNFGRAHCHEQFLALARAVRDRGVAVCFAGRGSRMADVQEAVRSDDKNVGFAGFAPEAELERRLGACDLHLVSLRPEWTGTVVPSKFFGALAAGRGVVFAGSPESAVAKWVREHRVGWVLTPDTLPAVAADLGRLAADPSSLSSLRARCHAVYHRHFSKSRQLDQWDNELRSVVGPPDPGHDSRK